jgi:HPt (histidine-containing phosphotransfer) domain-containing protein
MTKIPQNIDWVADLVPELEAQRGQFVVATDEVDDDLVEVFIEELERLTRELQQGMERHDLEMVRMAAHSIKGMGGTIGLPEISVLGLAIENTARENRLQDAVPMVDALATWLSTLA